MVSTNGSTAPYSIVPRQVHFDWQTAPLHWIHGDAFSSHGVNEFSYLLTQGEKFFCSVFREALPYVQDDKLRADVKAFIQQEAIHSRAHHESIEQYLQRFRIEGGRFERNNALLFEELLSAKPFGYTVPRFLQHQWLTLRVGIVATVEHFTCALGVFVLEADWEKSGVDPVVADLFRWHGAEEVEHRTVAYGLYRHLGGKWPMRVLMMSLVLPMLVGRMAAGTSQLIRQDNSMDRRLGNMFRPAFWRAWRAAGKRGNMPDVVWFLQHTLSFLRPAYEPIEQASTEQALDYINRSPAVIRPAA